MVAVLVFASALGVTAGPATAKPLDELDQRLSDYEVTLTGEPSEDERRIVEATDQLEQIVALAEALDDKHVARGMLRALEAYLILADALLVAPCPETLGTAACDLYRSMLAERAAILARTAMATATSLHSSGGVRGADRGRFDELTQRGSNTVAQAVMQIIESPAPRGPPAGGPHLPPARRRLRLTLPRRLASRWCGATPGCTDRRTIRRRCVPTTTLTTTVCSTPTRCTWWR